MRTLRATTFFAAMLPLAAAIPEPVRIEQGLVSGVAGSSPSYAFADLRKS